MTQEVETTVGPDVQADVVISPHPVVGQHSHSDTVVLPYIGSVTVNGGIYTVIFGWLAVLTIIEVLIAPPLDSLGFVPLKVFVLMGLAIIKALLVVMFYMHLRQDNRVFRIILALPLLIVVLGVLYLLSVPPAGGGGYLDPVVADPTNEAVGTFTPAAELTSEVAATAGVSLPIESTVESVDAQATSEADEPAATSAVSPDEAAATAEAEPTEEATAEAD
jgi:caa(3)-type oxidase subunit IV